MTGKYPYYSALDMIPHSTRIQHEPSRYQALALHISISNRFLVLRVTDNFPNAH